MIQKTAKGGLLLFLDRVVEKKKLLCYTEERNDKKEGDVV